MENLRDRSDLPHVIKLIAIDVLNLPLGDDECERLANEVRQNLTSESTMNDVCMILNDILKQEAEESPVPCIKVTASEVAQLMSRFSNAKQFLHAKITGSYKRVVTVTPDPHTTNANAVSRVQQALEKQNGYGRAEALAEYNAFRVAYEKITGEDYDPLTKHWRQHDLDRKKI